MSANQASFPIAAMARVLGVSKAGYYAWLQRPPSAHATADAALLKRVRTVHASSRQTYGAPRIHADLRGRGERHSRKRIARLMREAGLVGASHQHGGPITTRRDKDARPAPDLVRCFQNNAPMGSCCIVDFVAPSVDHWLAIDVGDEGDQAGRVRRMPLRN